MPVGKRDFGYRIPVNVQPEDMICLRIFIPNDQIYLEAMSGAFSDMGRWLNWEKDGTNRASLAAAVWKEAIDYTYENGWLNCGDNMDCCGEIIERLTNIELSLQGLENMNINVNTGCGCGCGCGSGSGIPQSQLPQQTEGYPLPPTPSNIAPSTPIDSWKCDAANQVVNDWIALYVNFKASVIGGDATIAAIISIAGALAVLTGGLTVGLTILAGIAGAAAITVLDWVQEWLEEHRPALVCAIVAGSTPAESYANVVAYIGTNKNTPLGATAGFFVQNQVTAVAQDTDWNLVFNPGSMTIDPSLVGSDCSGCSLSSPPAEVSGYEWRRSEVLQDVQASAYTLTKLIGSTGYRYTASITAAATNWDTMIKAVKPALAAGETIVGFTLMVTESATDGGINDPATEHVRLTGLVNAYEGAPTHRVLIVSTGDGGVHQTALTPAATFDEISPVSSSTAAQERTLTHYARVGVGQTPPGNIVFSVAEIYYAVKLA